MKTNHDTAPVLSRGREEIAARLANRKVLHHFNKRAKDAYNEVCVRAAKEWAKRNKTDPYAFRVALSRMMAYSAEPEDYADGEHP